MKRTLFFLTLGLIALLAISCDDRGSNTVTNLDISEGGITRLGGLGEPVFTEFFTLQIQNEFGQIPMRAYQPRVTFPHANGGSLKPVPVLILLAPQDGGALYYFDHGLQELADEMIASGEIQPMTIVCIANDRYFGGYFYANNYPGAGMYDDLIADSLITFLYEKGLFSPIDTSIKKPAIGGIGIGAYGAMRAMIRNPNLFGAISIADGPLDFDGPSGNSGLTTLFDDVLAEQGLLNDADWLTKYNYNGANHLSRLFTSAAYSFSPEDTVIDFTATTIDNLNTIEPGDSLRVITINSRELLSDAIDSASLVTSVIATPELNFHLPFDNTGAIRSAIWDWWIDDNLENLLTPSVLSGKNIWVGNSTGLTFGNYGEQTSSFINTLQGDGYPVTVYNYNAMGNTPAAREQYIYDLLREMLIFHSESFGD